MRIAYIGNFDAEFSTENDVADGFRQEGIDVDTVQENRWTDAGQVPEPEADHIGLLWTHTHGWGPDHPTVSDALTPWRRAGKPIIGYHLDVWWGLARQTDIYQQPYFRMVDRLITADGSAMANRRFGEAGVIHGWLPPAVSDRNPLDGTARPDRWPTGVVFVGQHRPNNYHPEWPHRDQLIRHMQRTFGRQFTVLPAGNDKIRGADLADVYATAGAVVGDSCFAGVRPGYWSDRIPETLGRRGRLIHPVCEWRGLFSEDHFAGLWRIGDWDGLTDTVRRVLDNPEGSRVRAEHGAEWVRMTHLYRHRAARLANIMLELHDDREDTNASQR